MSSSSHPKVYPSYKSCCNCYHQGLTEEGTINRLHVYMHSLPRHSNPMPCFKKSNLVLCNGIQQGGLLVVSFSLTFSKTLQHCQADLHLQQTNTQSLQLAPALSETARNNKSMKQHLTQALSLETMHTYTDVPATMQISLCEHASILNSYSTAKPSLNSVKLGQANLINKPFP